MIAATMTSAGRRDAVMGNGFKGMPCDADLGVRVDGNVGGFPYLSFCVNEIDDDMRTFFADTACDAIIRIFSLGSDDIIFGVSDDEIKAAGEHDDTGKYMFASESEDSDYFHVYISYVNSELASNGMVCPFGIILVPKQTDEACSIARKWIARR